MTEQELAELQALCDAATKGPWEWADWDTDDGNEPFTLQSPAHTRRDDRRYFPDMPNRVISAQDDEVEECDKAFIARARTAMPVLVAEVRRLREEEAEVERLMHELGASVYSIGETYGFHAETHGRFGLQYEPGPTPLAALRALKEMIE